MGMPGVPMGMQPGMQPGMRPGLNIPPKMPGIGNQAMQASKMGSGVVDDQSKAWCVLAAAHRTPDIPPSRPRAAFHPCQTTT